MDNQEIKRICTLLNEVDFIHKLSVDEINDLVSRFKRIVLKKEAVIIRQGHRGDSFFLISEGKLAVLIKKSDGSKVLIRHLFAGNYFGEISLLTGEKRTATVVAEEKSVLYRLSKNDFGRILSKNPAIIKGISHVVSMRRDQLTRKGEKIIEKKSLLKKTLRFFDLE